jgi:hypothetical protein
MRLMDMFPYGWNVGTCHVVVWQTKFCCSYLVHVACGPACLLCASCWIYAHCLMFCEPKSCNTTIIWTVYRDVFCGPKPLDVYYVCFSCIFCTLLQCCWFIRCAAILTWWSFYFPSVGLDRPRVGLDGPSVGLDSSSIGLHTPYQMPYNWTLRHRRVDAIGAYGRRRYRRVWS